LASDGRSIVQGALGWIWARSSLAIPLPGFRNLEQMQALVDAQRFGPLSEDVIQAITEQVKSANFAEQSEQGFLKLTGFWSKTPRMCPLFQRHNLTHQVKAKRLPICKAF
jgi:hypothetical protein